MAHSTDALVLAPVLIVCADRRARQGVREIFDTWGVPADEAQDTVDAAEKLLFRNPHSAVVCDELLPSGAAHELRRLLLWQGMEMPFVMAVERPWTPVTRIPNLRLLEKPLCADALWTALDDLMDGALARHQHTLDERDARAWSHRRPSSSSNPFLLCDSDGLDQSVGRRNDSLASLFEAGRQLR